jgi:hypothetical protein
MISLRHLCVLCVSVVFEDARPNLIAENAETQGLAAK